MAYFGYTSGVNLPRSRRSQQDGHGDKIGRLDAETLQTKPSRSHLSWSATTAKCLADFFNISIFFQMAAYIAFNRIQGAPMVLTFLCRCHRETSADRPNLFSGVVGSRLIYCGNLSQAYGRGCSDDILLKR